MSEYELHVLITDHLRDMHGMIEFWVSATFAVIVARFVAGDRLSRRVLWVMAALYAMATLLSFTRFTSCWRTAWGSTRQIWFGWDWRPSSSRSRCSGAW